MFIPDKGVNFYQAVTACKLDMKKRDVDIEILDFNDIQIRVSNDSNSDDLSHIYNLKHLLRQNKIYI